jgi:hypothetical protein
VKPTRTLAVLLVLLLVGLSPAAPAAAPVDGGRTSEGTSPERSVRRAVVKTKKIAPGLVFRKIVQKKIPRRTFVLIMDPTRAVTLDVTLSEAAMPAQRPLSRVVRTHGALAGINGDYSGNGDPFHVLAQDGELLQTSRQRGTLFAITADESRTYFEPPDVSITMTDVGTGRVLPIARWNDGPPAPGELAGFTPLGGTLEPPPGYSCSVRLLPQGPPVLAEPTGVERDYAVDAVGCQQAAMARNGGVVLTATPATDEAVELLTLTPGTSMRLHWTVGLAGVLDAVGGAPMLVRDGRLVGFCNSACGRHPRTGIGVTARGRILMVVVDGRQPRWSLGPTMAEFAQIMKDLGAVHALNLDGGGSSTMVVRDKVMNRPSDRRERAISNAVLVLPGPDPGEA